MKKILFSLVLLFSTAFSLFANGVLIIEGNYQGKNLYVQNQFASSGVGFCVYEVRVNNQVTTDEINSSAFEVDLTAFKFAIGAKVEVKIFHKEDCKPKVLNAVALKPKSTFEVVSIKVDKDGVLNWVAKSESGKLPYVVEQFRWNKWVAVGEVEGKGTADQNSYSFKVSPHTADNQFRVKQVDYTSKPRYSLPAKFKSMSPEISFSPQKVKDEIFFTANEKPSETMYEIYDSYGNIVKKGFGSKVSVNNLSKGIYYINFDNKTDQFIKK